jgi:excisionase family DNA binding protein
MEEPAKQRRDNQCDSKGTTCSQRVRSKFFTQRSKELYRKAPKRHSGRVLCRLVNTDEVGTVNSASVSGGDDDSTTEVSVGSDETEWLSTQEAARRLGITPRTLYRFIDHGDLPAYRFGRVIRLRAHEVEAFIESSRIKPGELEHLYPEPVSREDD